MLITRGNILVIKKDTKSVLDYGSTPMRYGGYNLLLL